MTVLGLKLSRRANAVSSLHGQVSRAMWGRLWPGKPEEEVPIGHITNGVHVPSGWPRRCAASTTATSASAGSSAGAGVADLEEIDNVDDGELWETHLSLKKQLLAFVRRRAQRAVRRRGEPPETLQQLGNILIARRAHHRLRPPLCHLQAGQPAPRRHRAPRRRWSTTPSARCSSSSPARPTRTTSRASTCCNRSPR